MTRGGPDGRLRTFGLGAAVRFALRVDFRLARGLGPDALPLPAARFLLAAPLAALLAACATPVAPSGGPADTTPPTLVSSVPAAGALRVAAREAVLTFSERLDPAGAARAVRVTPEGAAPPRVSVRGSQLVIAFDSLREATTVVVTVGTDLTDARRVALRAPVTVAFSTGDRIDAGRIEGVVRDPATDAPARGLAVFAYALADAPTDSLGTRADTTRGRAAPDYRTETGPDGRFRLDYLRAGPYAVAVVADGNRNGRADAGERFAASPVPVLLAAEPAETRPDATDADSAGADQAQADSTRSAPAPTAPPDAPLDAPVFWTTALDTIPPAPRTVRVLSNRRLSVRFSEPVRLLDRAAFAVEDSLSGRGVSAVASVEAGAPAEVVVVADAPLAATPHRLRVAAGALADSSGTPGAAFVRTFTPAARADTVVARFAGVEPADSVLVPGQPLRLRWSSAPDAAARAAVRVTDAAGAAVAATLDPDGRRLVLPDRRAGTFSVSVPPGDSARTARVRVLGADALGSVVGRVDAAGRRVVVEAVPDGQPFGETAVRATVGPDGAFEIAGLRPGPLRLRFFEDRDGDGRWSGGRLAPYAPPEPLAFAGEPAAVRARWEADVGVLRLPTTPRPDAR